MIHRLRFFFRLLFPVLVWGPALLIFACSKPPPAEQEPSGPGESPAPAVSTVKPRFILEPGETPLWFELGPGGPEWISSPGEASLAHYQPWPLARHISGMLARGDRLTLAVNREGFLAFTPGQPGGPGLALFRAADPGYWGDYTVAALFDFQGTAAALLYRNDFFVDSNAALPPVRVWGFEPGKDRPAELVVPAFVNPVADEGWDIETLRQGRDGLWYYRGVKKDGPLPEIRYLRTPDPGREGESCSAGVFRNAVVPYTKNSAPPLLRLALEEAERRFGPGPQVAAVVSPEFPVVRYFSAGGRDDGVNPGEGQGPGSGGEGLFTELAGYYRDGAAGGSAAGAADVRVAGTGAGIALVVLPDGRGVRAAGEDSAPRAGPFSLPPLPEGFVYTRISLVEGVVVAAWEEQEGWNIGAAGFLVIKGP